MDQTAKCPEGERGQEKRQPDLIVNLLPYQYYTVVVKSPQFQTDIEFYGGKLTGVKKTETIPVPK